MNKQPLKTTIGNNRVIVGAAFVGTVAAIAGTYFLYGSKNASKHRKQVKAWSLKAKGEILERIENLSEITEDIYNQVVAEVTDRYRALKHIDKSDVVEFAQELRGHWNEIAKDAKAVVIKKKSPKQKGLEK